MAVAVSVGGTCVGFSGSGVGVGSTGLSVGGGSVAISVGLAQATSMANKNNKHNISRNVFRITIPPFDLG
jgi:hypothetical protein